MRIEFNYYYYWSIPGRGKRFSCLHSVQTGSETHSAYYPTDTKGFFQRVKWPGREADHSPSSTAEVKLGCDANNDDNFITYFIIVITILLGRTYYLMSIINMLDIVS
jgi:hypothetical protein